MNSKLKFTLASSFLAISAQGAGIAVNASGATAADIQAVVDGFRTTVSGGRDAVNAPGSGPFTDGRRQVNWDAAGLDTAAANGSFPGNFFNANSPRGLDLSVTTGNMVVSGRPAAGSADLRFSTINPSFETDFTTFSPDRLFGLTGTNFTDANFFVPSAPSEAASIIGFGAVFTDVDLADSARIDVFDLNDQMIGRVFAEPEDNGLSFAGIHFDAGETIGRVRIYAGTGGLDSAATADFVAIDDFIYSEPQAVPEPSAILLTALSCIGLIARRRRS